MLNKINRSMKTSVQLLLVVTAALLIWGCGGSGGGSSSYDTPTVTDNSAIKGAATNVLVDAAALKSWMDDGLVTAGSSTFDRKVVILDFGPYAMTASDPVRIKGACRVATSSLNSTRVEGVAVAYPMVATGEQMDAVIQSLGIDENTTIVFTTDPSMSGGAMFYATRAYWMFRYWGFPQERLKVLDGGNTAFAAAYAGLMTTEAPVPVRSSYSVKQLAGSLNADLRMSINEMLGLVKNFNSATDVLLDARGATNYSGLASSPGYVTGRVDYVVYDGHPTGAQYLSQGELFNADKTFKTKEQIEALFAAKGWSLDKMTTVYCLSGYSATPLYFAMETILGAPARLYDGSWSQFGQYSDYTAKLGQLTPTFTSAWATDQYLAVGEGYRYNFDYLAGQTVTVPWAIESLQLDAAAIAAQPSPFTGDVPADDSDVVQSQIEAADAAYVGNGAPLAFPAPAATATPSVLIEAADLQGWIDAALLNAPLGSERVVLLDVTTGEGYIQGHIPGAQLWNVAEQAATRVEGPAPAVNMVLSGAAMDAMIQKHAIDENTTIVLTSSQVDTYYASRAYFLFRYYGFPKERLKVLNGYNWAWPSSLTSISYVPTAPSTLSVQDIANIQLDTRVSLSELMDAVRDGRGVAVDMRGNKSAAGSTPGVFADVAGDYVVFEGTVGGGTSYVWKNFNDNYASPATGGLRFKDAATIATALNGIGLDGSQMVYSYCRTGYIASTGFFVLDGILDWPVMTYDGSWSQWGKMSADASKGGELPAGSAWATDSATYMDVINYNKGNVTTRLKTIEALNPDADLMALDPSDPETNQIENADTEYKVPSDSGTDTGGTPTSGSGSSGGGC